MALADSAMQGIARGARVGAQPPQHLEAVEVGQLQVDQHEVGAQGLRPRHAGAAGPSDAIARPDTVFTSSSTRSTLTWLSSM
jgi:hypothetical protein